MKKTDSINYYTFCYSQSDKDERGSNGFHRSRRKLPILHLQRVSQQAFLEEVTFRFRQFQQYHNPQHCQCHYWLQFIQYSVCSGDSAGPLLVHVHNPGSQGYFPYYTCDKTEAQRGFEKKCYKDCIASKEYNQSLNPTVASKSGLHNTALQFLVTLGGKAKTSRGSHWETNFS